VRPSKLEARFFNRVAQITNYRKVDDCWQISQHKVSRLKALINNRKGAFGSRLQKGQYRWMWRLGSKGALKAVRGEIAREFVIVKKEPTQHLNSFIGVFRSKLTGGFSEPSQNGARL
jgi:hypothetical protein